MEAGYMFWNQIQITIYEDDDQRIDIESEFRKERQGGATLRSRVIRVFRGLDRAIEHGRHQFQDCPLKSLPKTYM